ncbi:hypothetical protein Ciccas_001085 [Cichlidogyrus casuarinus]|uniref:Uncharacterized protein n=1 Tax=Cichlidogyrus casuarinus TaxID=1844966 RepID=A0ABD2QM71_9PLAT
MGCISHDSRTNPGLDPLWMFNLPLLNVSWQACASRFGGEQRAPGDEQLCQDQRLRHGKALNIGSDPISVPPLIDRPYDELADFCAECIEEKMEPLPYPNHGQMVERGLQETTAASKMLTREDQREACVILTQMSRNSSASTSYSRSRHQTAL